MEIESGIQKDQKQSEGPVEARRRVVVTLVHGTFARGADWTLSDSPLCLALHAALGPDLVVQRFEWTGKNSHRARSEAADMLAHHLNASRGEHVSAAHFVIAHSHGGNVAVMSLRQPGVEAAIDGIVCLSTPFLHFRESTPLAIMFRRMTAFFALAPLLVLSRVFSLSSGVMWLALGAATIVSLVIESRVFRGARLSAADFSLPSVPKQKLLILRTLGDEASGLLGLCSLAQWVMLRGESVTIGLPRSKAAWAVAGVAYVGPLLLFDWFPSSRFLEGYFWQTLAVISGSLLALLAPLYWLLLAAFGSDLPRKAGHLMVTAEATPLGDWDVTTLPFQARRPSTTPAFNDPAERDVPLMHSETYGDSGAIAQVCEWIEVRAKGRVVAMTSSTDTPAEAGATEA